MNQRPAALYVGEELVAEAGALRRALDQSPDVGQDELALAVVDRAQHRLDRRERVAGDLRTRAWVPPRATTRPRSAGRPVPRPPEGAAAADPALHPGQPLLGEPRRLPRRGREALVPVAPLASRSDHGPLPRLGQVVRRAVGRDDRRPRGDQDLAVRPARLVLLLAAPVLAAARAEVPADPELGEITSGRVADEHDVPPRPPSPPSGPPRGTCDSRLKLTTPLPPRPPSTQILALSWNTRSSLARPPHAERPSLCP